MTNKTRPFRDIAGANNSSFRDIVGEISNSVDQLLKSGLNKKAVIILLCHQTKLPQKDVKKVLEELSSLTKNFASTKEN